MNLTIGCTATGFPLLRSSKPAHEPGVNVRSGPKPELPILPKHKPAFDPRRSKLKVLD